MVEEKLLTKSLYLRGLQCEKSLWLKINNSDVLEDEDIAISQIFETGRKVGALACNLFPNGKRISFGDTVRDQRIALTKQWIVDGVSTIYEATFEFDGVLVMVDILNRDSDGNFEIYEVKSSSWNSKKKLKDIDTYIKDVSIQYYVLNGCGLNISKAAVTLLNGDYIRGDELNINDLFIHQIVTDEAISLQDRIPDTLRSFKGSLNEQEIEPDIDIGWHCKKPYKCDASEYCWRVQRQIPEYSVFNIFPLTKKSKALKLYHQGIVNIDDIPESFKLTDRQRLAVDASKSLAGRKPQINREKLELFLSSLSYPLYYLDFETSQQPIPEFKGISPFQQIPFQYSVHIEQQNQTIEHKEFLGKEGSDPREQL
ncbi:MAG: phosphomethylpyrimidine kinase, partial [Rhodospirillaceae bacterium]|nr:phosphomethylpyrimidine kinase [Rhodospirillaceae bacterium]